MGSANNAIGLFQVVNTGSGTAIEGTNTSSANNITAVVGAISQTSPGGYSTGVRGLNNGTGNNGIGVWGSQNGSGYGVYGTTPTGYAVYGQASTSGTGVYGKSVSGTGIYAQSNSGNALVTDGFVQMIGIGEAAGKVLTSDASGNATWQDNSTPFIHFSSTGGSSQAIPTGVITTINSWLGLEETGGANYNATTGEYTIPITGYYKIIAKVNFMDQNTVNSDPAHLTLLLDGAFAAVAYTNNAVVGTDYTEPFLYWEKKLTAGQKVTISVFQTGRPTNQLYKFASTFSIDFLHK